MNVEFRGAPAAFGRASRGGFWDRHFALLALGPAFLTLVVLSLPPTVGALALAFRNDTLSGRHSRWVGLFNFRRMLTDARLLNALEVSLLWEAVTVTGTMIVAIALGILIFERLRGRPREVICLALIVPVLLPRVSAGLAWRFMYSPLMGVLNYPIQLMHLRPIDFLSQTSIALYSVAIVDIWQWGPFFAVIVYNTKAL